MAPCAQHSPIQVGVGAHGDGGGDLLAVVAVGNAEDGGFHDVRWV